jgi:hypothetical protein
MTPNELSRHIPPEVEEAAARALCKEDGRIPDAVIAPDGLRGFLAWENYKPKARAALAAGLAAWPGVKEHTIQVPDDSDEVRYMLKTIGLILPLPTEPSHD